MSTRASAAADRQVNPTIELTVNGRVRQVDVPAGTPLLWVLRDTLELTGTKYGCGQGLCGSCTVHLDGQPIRSCVIPVSAAVGRRVTTIEGLSPDGTHPLQLAWIQANVPQCGYCQAGQIMSAAALLSETPRPTEREIHRALADNLCRCGTYRRILAAIKIASGQGEGP